MLSKEVVKKKLIVGVVHLPPLPGTPYYQEGDLERAIEKTKRCVSVLIEGGAGGCLLQPIERAYHVLDDADYARVAAMTVIVKEARKTAGDVFQVGLQFLWNGVRPALAAAKIGGADFIRCSAICGTVVTPYGTIEADADQIMGYRRQINALQVRISSEVAGYHVAGDHIREEELRIKAGNIVMAGADMFEVYHPNAEYNDWLVKRLKEIREDIPVILGGGTGIETVKQRLKFADGAYVGSCFEDGLWGGEMKTEIVKQYMQKVKEAEEGA